MALDLTKPLRTKDRHWMVKYLATINGSHWWAVWDGFKWITHCRQTWGKVGEEIENLPEMRELHLRIGVDSAGRPCCWNTVTDIQAKFRPCPTCVSIIHVRQTYEVGEGLS